MRDEEVGEGKHAKNEDDSNQERQTMKA